MACFHKFYLPIRLDVCHNMHRPSGQREPDRLILKAFSLLRKNRRYFRETGRNYAVVRRRTAIYNNVSEVSN